MNHDPGTLRNRSRPSMWRRFQQLPARKRGIFAGLIAVIIVLIAAALTYAYVYQNPTKVVSDGIMQALNSRSVVYTGTFTNTSGNKVTVDFNGGADTQGGSVDMKLNLTALNKKYTIDGSGLLSDKGDLYFKIKNIDELVQNYRKSVPAASQGLFDQIVAKINDKWIKISSDDLKSYSPEIATAQRCLTDTFKRMQTDETLRSEAAIAYKQNPFIVIEKSLGSKDGSLGYLLTVDSTKAKSFTTAFRATSFYKILNACDKNLELKVDDLKSDKPMNQNTNVELWVNNWNHQITKVVVSDKKNTTNLTVMPHFNKPVSVTTPRESTTLDQLQKDIQDLLVSAANAQAR